MPEEKFYHPDYLMHYGVLGMKWGHRKARYSKSRRPSLGKKIKRKIRANKAASNKKKKIRDAVKKEAKKKEAQDRLDRYENSQRKKVGLDEKPNRNYSTDTKNKYVNPSTLSYQELEAVVNRMKLEETYNKYMNPPTKKSKNRERAERLMDKALDAMVSKAASKGTDMLMDKFKDNLNDKDRKKSK